MDKHKRELLIALMSGRSMEEIAAGFSTPLSEQTLKQYCYILYRIYGVKNRVELMAKFYLQLTTPEAVEALCGSACSGSLRSPSNSSN